jgi:excisionase family DNA binding protein
MNPNNQPLTLTVNETAQALNISRATVYQLIRAGRLRTLKAGRRTLIPRRELDAFLERELEGGQK